MSNSEKVISDSSDRGEADHAARPASLVPNREGALADSDGLDPLPLGGKKTESVRTQKDVGKASLPVQKGIERPKTIPAGALSFFGSSKKPEPNSKQGSPNDTVQSLVARPKTIPAGALQFFDSRKKLDSDETRGGPIVQPTADLVARPKPAPAVALSFFGSNKKFDSELPNDEVQDVLEENLRSQKQQHKRLSFFQRRAQSWGGAAQMDGPRATVEEEEPPASHHFPNQEPNHHPTQAAALQARPGAYLGAPGGLLLRAASVDYSNVVGRYGSAEPTRVRHSGQQLAQASPVLDEDTERQAASPVDLEAESEQQHQ